MPVPFKSRGRNLISVMLVEDMGPTRKSFRLHFVSQEKVFNAENRNMRR